MKKENPHELETVELKRILNNFILELEKLELILVEEIVFYQKIKIEWVRENDFRPGTFSRLLSNIISTKFYSKRVLEYLCKSNWKNDFIENYTPQPWKK